MHPTDDAISVDRDELAPRWIIGKQAASSTAITRIEYDVDVAKMERDIFSAADTSKIREGYVGLLGYSIFAFIEGREESPDPTRSPSARKVARVLHARAASSGRKNCDHRTSRRLLRTRRLPNHTRPKNPGPEKSSPRTRATPSLSSFPFTPKRTPTSPSKPRSLATRSISHRLLRLRAFLALQRRPRISQTSSAASRLQLQHGASRQRHILHGHRPRHHRRQVPPTKKNPCASITRITSHIPGFPNAATALATFRSIGK